MNVVLYNRDWEPITIIDLTPRMLDFLVKNGEVSFPVRPEINYTACNNPYECIKFPMVRVWAEKIRFSNKRNPQLLLFTDNEEYALKLDAKILPGQQKTFNDNYREGISKGFLDGLYTALQLL